MAASKYRTFQLLQPPNAAVNESRDAHAPPPHPPAMHMDARHAHLQPRIYELNGNTPPLMQAVGREGGGAGLRHAAWTAVVSPEPPGSRGGIFAYER